MFPKALKHLWPRAAHLAALACFMAVPATGALAKSPSLSYVACMARDLPRMQEARLPLSVYCAHRSGALRVATGRGNSAMVQQNGARHTAQVQQGEANNRAEIHQRGRDHSANLVQEGGHNSQVIFQFGRGTQADIHQTGGQSGVLIQFGW
jgi:hypothetical protein